MRVVTLTLIAVCLFAIMGCDSNDKNTLNSIPKSHKLNPVFTVAIEGGDVAVPGREIQLTVEPSVGWTGEVFTDSNGFVSTLAAGTFIATIDTTVRFPGTDSCDTVADTTYTTYSFQPSQTYTFGLHRSSSLKWFGSPTPYAATIDSSWIKRTVGQREILDSGYVDLGGYGFWVNYARFDSLMPDSIAMISSPTDTVGNSPYQTMKQVVLHGFWFDTAYVIANPADTIDFPPDSTRYDTVTWGYWGSVVRFGHMVAAVDSGQYCSDGDCYWVIDTVDIPGGSWGNFDTIIHTFTAENGLVFGSNELSIYDWTRNGRFFTCDTAPAQIYLITNIDYTTDTTVWDSSNFRITMPASDVPSQPDYLILVK